MKLAFFAFLSPSPREQRVIRGRDLREVNGAELERLLNAKVRRVEEAELLTFPLSRSLEKSRTGRQRTSSSLRTRPPTLTLLLEKESLPRLPTPISSSSPLRSHAIKQIPSSSSTSGRQNPPLLAPLRFPSPPCCGSSPPGSACWSRKSTCEIPSSPAAASYASSSASAALRLRRYRALTRFAHSRRQARARISTWVRRRLGTRRRARGGPSTSSEC